MDVRRLRKSEMCAVRGVRGLENQRCLWLGMYGVQKFEFCG